MFYREHRVSRGFLPRLLIVLMALCLFVPVAYAKKAPRKQAPEEAPTTDTLSSIVPRPPRTSSQVRVHVKVLEWTTDLSREYGFRVLYSPDSDTGSIVGDTDMTFPMSGGSDVGMRVFLDRLMTGSGSFNAVIECLEQYGDVEVLSEPNIICPVEASPDEKHPYQAKITTGSRIPYEKARTVGDTLAQVTDFRDVGVTLSVGVRKIVENQYVQLVVQVNVTNLAGYISVGTNKDGQPLLVPEVSSRQISNILLAENEKTLITGLLVSESKTASEKGVPIMARLPWIGPLFGSRKKSHKRQELVFLIRPEIIYD